jgi:hypothetical protein
MYRRWGNLWRYRNEGVEAFNKTVSLRHKMHNGKGGRKRTRAGEPVQTCPEFWSLGQWLGRWSMWQLGYGDDMDPDRRPRIDFHTPHVVCDGPDPNQGNDSDDTPYTTESSSNDDASDDDLEDDESPHDSSDDDESVTSVEVLTCYIGVVVRHRNNLAQIIHITFSVCCSRYLRTHNIEHTSGRQHVPQLHNTPTW